VTALLAGRVALVTGGDSSIGRELTLGLADQGATVAVTGRFDSREAAAAAFGDAAAANGPIDVVVHSPFDPDALVAETLADTDVASWARRCEALLLEALWCSQAAYGAFAGRGGHLVFVTPTVALSGAAGLVPYTTALEGIRALAKSAARQWGEFGIRVNCVAPPVEIVEPATGARGPWIGELALGRAPDARTDLAPVVALLTAEAAHFVTGATVTVDGGILMAP
jgi:3-oxoacyl-[acyl-carrier protein] reductase